MRHGQGSADEGPAHQDHPGREVPAQRVVRAWRSAAGRPPRSRLSNAAGLGACADRDLPPALLGFALSSLTVGDRPRPLRLALDEPPDGVLPDLPGPVFTRERRATEA